MTTLGKHSAPATRSTVRGSNLGWPCVETSCERVMSSGDLGIVVPELTSFGVDGLGRVHAMSLRGDLFRLDPKRAT